MSLARRIHHKSMRYRRRARGLALASWVRLWGGYAGKRIMVDTGLHLRHAPNRYWSIGAGVYLGKGVILDVRPNAGLVIGMNAKIMHHVVIGSAEHITIGANTQVAEFSSIRDAEHGIDTNVLMRQSPLVVHPISIGDNVWIARGVAVLAGADIGSGAVIGANSVVKTLIPVDAIAVGAPARVIRQRRTTSGTKNGPA